METISVGGVVEVVVGDSILFRGRLTQAATTGNSFGRASPFPLGRTLSTGDAVVFLDVVFGPWYFLDGGDGGVRLADQQLEVVLLSNNGSSRQ